MPAMLSRPLPPKASPPSEVRTKMAKAVGERNEVEYSFDTGKRVYRVNNIRAKLLDRNVLLCQKRDEVPEGALLCSD